MTELTKLTMAQAAAGLERREFSSRELTETCLARIEALEPSLNAFITVTPEVAIADAKAADAAFAAGRQLGPLHGIPVGVKDLCATKGIRTTAGSKVLEDWVPDYNATVVSKLREGGAVSLGKLNLHEFAYGTTSANQWYGPVHNPWNLDRHPGGSSGGSGAAVAAGECFAAIGSDTGGSIRIPASLCGIVGLMPTYGLVSRAGVAALSWSLDHIGPLARTVEDAARFLNGIAGYDPADPGSVRRDGFDATTEIGRNIRGLRIGLARSQFARCEPETTTAVEAALEVLRKLGAVVEDVRIPMLDAGLRLSIIQAEASAYHVGWLRESPEKYSEQVRSNLLHGLTVPAHQYLNDLRLRRELTDEVRAVMQTWDAIATPTCERGACRIDDGDPGYRFAALTAPWDHTGQPVISVPCGFDGEGMPLGISFAGRPFEEALLCRIAHAYEQATEWHSMAPPI